MGQKNGAILKVQNTNDISPYKKVHIIIQAKEFYRNPRRNALKSVYNYIHVTHISYQKIRQT
jgi:hypothetical protein